ncbi:PIF1 helicase-like protein [Trypanosoma theileri]|uniref:ATP-dependent DNA helicase n=1 Tax=Trypanosoma theileri TaxID=67003 RepID=A0A1X0NVS9_9TRYP|nr:PIF1 helicase-like protein [Trypanosoma theileri]ORC88583.1 PIF1 helicase-like protein [Trypanosoma theileri]
MFSFISVKAIFSNYASSLVRIVNLLPFQDKTLHDAFNCPVLTSSLLLSPSPSLLPHASTSLAHVVLSFHTPPLARRVPRGFGSGAVRFCYHHHYYNKQKQRLQGEQVASSMAFGALPLWYQCRGFMTSGTGGADNERCEIASSSVLSVQDSQQEEKQKQEQQQYKKDRPRLICLARRSDRYSVGATTVISTQLRRKAIMNSETRMVAKISSGNCSSSHIEPLGNLKEEINTENVRNDQKFEEEKEPNNYSSGVKEENKLSVFVNAPPFPHSISSGTSNRDNNILIYNIFTHRVVKHSASSIRALGILGIGVRHDTQELDVVSPDALDELRVKLIAKEVSWPQSWRSTIYQQLYYILLRSKDKDEAVSKVQELLKTQYERIKSRPNAGVVEDNTNTSSGDGTPVESGRYNVNMTFQERLLRYCDLNNEQQQVVDFVLEGYNTYIGGGAGTGKSLLIRVIKQELMNRGLSVAVTATTGIAATRVGGTTLHHSFGVNIYGEFMRRAELRAYDVIIVDEVSMLSKELFESLEYQLRRANGVDLPFGGVQIILCGDFLQLGAIASTPLVHSSIFRRHFAMLKLQHVVRQVGNSLFVQQLQELRRGVVPHDLQDTVTFLSPAESAKAMKDKGEGAVKLLPTNKEVDAINQRELDKLHGELAVFPSHLCSPTLAGRWSATYMLQIQDESMNISSNIDKLTLILEQYVLEYVSKVPHASTLTLSLLGQRHIVLYKLFVDAFAFRVRIPAEMNEKDEAGLAAHLRSLESWLPAHGLGVSLREIITSPNGLHTDADEHTLTRQAAHAPMAAPLRLKRGARVMLRTNLTSELVNGSIGVVVGFTELRPGKLPRHLATPARLEAMEAYIDSLLYEHGFDAALAPEVDFGGGKIVVVPPTTFTVGGLSNTNHYHMGIVALPLSLAYAFTVHKVQGLTLVGRVHLELSRMWPCEHLLYVAMSRVRNPEQLTVSSFQNDLVRCATECLLFDDSLPTVEKVKVLPHFFQSTWRRTPGRRKASLREKLRAEVKRRQWQQEKEREMEENNGDNAKRQKTTLKKNVDIIQEVI